jgi:hypothetical protein
MTVATDLRPKFGAARDQGTRPTCLAFAMSDAHRAARSQGELFAADYAHYHAARRMNATMNAAVSTEAMREALEQDGQPLEAQCAYTDPRADDWKPPADVGALWKRPSALAKAAPPSEVLRVALGASRAHVLTLLISEAFYAPDPVTFEIADDASPDVGEHAVVVVGSRAAGDFYLVRNSWGVDWGVEGYAWLAKRYVDARAIDIVEF